MFRYQRALSLALWGLVLSLSLMGCGADGVTEKIDSGADNLNKRATARNADWDQGLSDARAHAASSGADPQIRANQDAATGNGTSSSGQSASYDMPNSGMETGEMLKMLAFGGLTLAFTTGFIDLQNIFPRNEGANQQQAVAQNGQNNQNAGAQQLALQGMSAPATTAPAQNSTPVNLNQRVVGALRNAYSSKTPMTANQIAGQTLQLTQAVVQNNGQAAPSTGATVQNNHQGRSSGDEKNKQAAAVQTTLPQPQCESAAAPGGSLAQGYVNAVLQAAENQKNQSSTVSAKQGGS